MKRYNVDLHTWYEHWSEEDFHEARMIENPKGEYVKACEAIRLENKVKRMQRRIDALEGRA